ncbi:MAG TPA: hydrolase [Porphyromonadaceae bacterium]|jgi:hypothetical protein|nr:hydrolase [Porphyromonadaceae bacterium]
MDRIIIFFIGLLLLCTSRMGAQTIYYTADQFPLIGKTSEETETRYERLPAYLKDICRPPVWNLGKNTSGLAVRFRSNSTSISAKWEASGNNQMNHMTETGIKGLDLYTWIGDHWQPVKAALPSGKKNEQTIISNMIPSEREYLLYLPLYDGIVSLEIGIDSAAYIQNPRLPYPKTDHPVFVYGTSITQGGCASRPGMSYTNILERKLNREVINLGFSGNGQLDYEIAELMASRNDASVFVLDFIPNVNAQQIRDKTARFFAILREKNPQTPILFVESVLFTHMPYDKTMRETVLEKNRLLKEEYQKIKKQGDKNVYYLESSSLIGTDGESTVDGIHLTDLGFSRFAVVLEDKLTEIVFKK